MLAAAPEVGACMLTASVLCAHVYVCVFRLFYVADPSGFVLLKSTEN